MNGDFSEFRFSKNQQTDCLVGICYFTVNTHFDLQQRAVFWSDNILLIISAQKRKNAQVLW